MDIEHFREILFWPFFLKDNCDDTFEQILQGGGWKEEESFYQRHYASNDRAKSTRYGEFVYFQPYVQRFLFGNGEKAPPTQVWRRREDDDIAQVSVCLKGYAEAEAPMPLRFDIEQLWLFRFRLGEGHSVMMLSLEIASQAPLPLGLCQDFLDQFRRVYPPYFENGAAGRFPSKVTWHKRSGDEQAFNVESLAIFDEQVKAAHRPALAKHWCWLLGGGNISPTIMENLRLVEDERMATMAYLALKAPRTLSRGDFIRLCFADDQGRSDTLPYAPSFLNDFEKHYCYDRYWDPEPNPTGMNWLNTRAMNCGYAFTLIGEYSGDQNHPYFFSDAESGALSHFRNHYFLMGLIVHFQKAALLSFSDQLSCAVNDHPDKVLQQQAKKTQRQILDFCDRYWFIHLSTQTQAQELYTQWRKQLKLDELYSQVTEESRQLSEYLENEANKREANMVTILTWAGVIFAIVSICADFGLKDLLKNQVSHELQLATSAILGLLAILFVIRLSRR